MTDRPIIFSAPMVRALLDGRKTQTRRVLCQFDPDRDPPHAGPYIAGHKAATWTDREGTPWRYPGAKGAATGDRLYVREAHALVPASAYRMSEGVQQVIDPTDRDRACIYAEGWERCKPRWRPSIHMPRWASRLTLTVTDVRVQRLQEISQGDAEAEGWGGYMNSASQDAAGNGPRTWFRKLWNDLHGPDAWDANPWVVALTFNVKHGNIDDA